MARSAAMRRLMSSKRAIEKNLAMQGGRVNGLANPPVASSDIGAILVPIA